MYAELMLVIRIIAYIIVILLPKSEHAWYESVDCLPDIGRPGRYNYPPGSYAPPFGPSYEHHHQRLPDHLVGPGPAPSRYGPPPPYVPGPLAGPLDEDPFMFDPPGPPRY
ncbi:hypothetical protein DCAR_0102540 [Daucus carota subsp. sativus]|uniref:Uncharacterized protein n=1 Tax=Daucus carota subsp. sativus TaxID=79200 RepID=A0A166H6K2_DAUCS|nr:hypothetical protein DCAR_0102540 [Daucus carota subsp. sativus]